MKIAKVPEYLNFLDPNRITLNMKVLILFVVIVKLIYDLIDDKDRKPGVALMDMD